ncbi:MAG: glycosyltransferase [Eubacteriales bacterium]|nr:glycosyltransferase [Eubacteriales bacterium]
MKILYLDVLCKTGSTGKIVYELCTRSLADGDTAAVCYGRGEKLNESFTYKFGLDWETTLHALLTRVTGRTGCYSYFSTERLIKFMDEFKPDVVHLHEPHAYFINLRPFFEYLSAHEIPLVYTFHCEFAFTGKCGHPLECENWKTGCGSCPHIRDYPKSLFFDRTASMYEEKKELLLKQNMIITSPSKWLADRAKQSFLSGCEARVIPNGIDTEVFRKRDTAGLRANLGLKNEKTVLAVVPDLSFEHKGIPYVLELVERMKNDNVKFILVGKKDEKSVFPENVLAVGRTENQRELAGYYSLADCFVICSDMENLPTTCLEAVCCGTPVAGFDVGGTAETAPAPTGKFCAYGDLDALEKNVRCFLASPPPAEAFEALRERYSGEIMYNSYRKLFDELTGSRK